MSDVQFKVLDTLVRIERMKVFCKKHNGFVGYSAVSALEDIEVFLDNASNLDVMYENARMACVHANHVWALLNELGRQEQPDVSREALLAVLNDATAVYSVCATCVDYLSMELSQGVWEGTFLVRDLVEASFRN